MPTRELRVEIVGDASSLQRTLGTASSQAQSFGARVQKSARIAGLALGAGFAGLIKVGFDELKQSQAVAAQTAAALQSTGGAANVTAKQIDSLAQSLSSMSGIDDETIQSGENLLLTFTNIRNEVGKGNDIFNQATGAITDMSVALGQDMKSSAIQLGKALNDPIKGVTALRRVGVSFTAAQMDQIKALTASGKTMEAQKLILRELNKEFGGSAKAAGETLGGQLARARVAFENMAGSMVELLLPAFLKFATAIQEVSTFLNEHKTIAKAAFVALGALAGILLTISVTTKAWAAIQAVARAATIAWTAAQWLLNVALEANPIGLVVVAIGALVAAVILAYKHSETFRRIVTGAFDAVKAAATAVLNFFRQNWPIIVTLISGPFAPIVALATNAFGVRSALIGAANAIIDFFRQNWKTIAVVISGPFAPLVALATNAFGIRSALVSAFGAIVEGVRAKVSALVGLIAGLPGRLGAVIGDLSHVLYNAGVSLIQGLIDGIQAQLGKLLSLLDRVTSLIPIHKGPPAKDAKLLRKSGELIMGGLEQGLRDGWGSASKFLSSIGPQIQTGPTFATSATGLQPAGAVSGGTMGTGGVSAQITVPVYLDGVLVTESVRREMLRFEKRNGRSAV